MVMQQPFPALRHLYCGRYDSYGVPVLPREFLGRSAPCLQTFELLGIPFPALPSFFCPPVILSRSNLFNIPRSWLHFTRGYGYGSGHVDQARTLTIEFESPASRPDRIRLPPATRTVLPALTPSDSAVLASIWRTSWHGSTPLNSTGSSYVTLISSLNLKSPNFGSSFTTQNEPLSQPGYALLRRVSF
jgi:hypothetical protein